MSSMTFDITIIEMQSHHTSADAPNSEIFFVLCSLESKINVYREGALLNSRANEGFKRRILTVANIRFNIIHARNSNA